MRVALFPDLYLCLDDYGGEIKKLATHEVRPRFLSSFLRSTTVSLSQLLDRRTVETNDRALGFTALNRGLVAGRRVGSIPNTR